MYRFLLFAFLSLCDLTLTWWLLTSHSEFVYESNPVANWFLAAFGWTGVAGFKFAMVALLFGCVCRIARRRPQVARRILSGGCVALGGVVLYSCYLANAAADHSANSAVEQQRILKLNQRDKIIHDYRNLSDRLTADLIVARISLEDAVAQLAETDKVRNTNWMEILKISHPDFSTPAFLAMNLLENARQKLEGAPSRNEVMSRLRNEFTARFGANPVGSELFAFAADR